MWRLVTPRPGRGLYNRVHRGGSRTSDSKCQLVHQPGPKQSHGPLSLEDRVEPGFEMRRILLLTRLREYSKGLTMDQLVNYCRQVSGWAAVGQALSEVVRHILQSLIDDKLVVARTRFLITPHGREYLEDPLKWQMEIETLEVAERNVFWKNIYDVFDKAYARLRQKSKPVVREEDSRRRPIQPRS